MLGTDFFPCCVIATLAGCSALLVKLPPPLLLWLVPARAMLRRSDWHMRFQPGNKKGRVACWLHDPEVWLLRKCIFRNFGRKKCGYV
jgi:hypothetical protein